MGPTYGFVIEVVILASDLAVDWFPYNNNPNPQRQGLLKEHTQPLRHQGTKKRWKADLDRYQRKRNGLQRR